MKVFAKEYENYTDEEKADLLKTIPLYNINDKQRAYLISFEEQMKEKYNGRVFYKQSLLGIAAVLSVIGGFRNGIVCVDSELCSELCKNIARKEQKLKALESYLTQLYCAYCEALGDTLPYDGSCDTKSKGK